MLKIDALKEMFNNWRKKKDDSHLERLSADSSNVEKCKYRVMFDIDLDLNAFQEIIKEVVFDIYKMLIEKNKRYGSSVLTPKRIFSNADPIAAINVRIDDKLSRIEQQTKSGISDTEDSELDLCGYLILKMAVKKYFANIEKKPLDSSL